MAFGNLLMALRSRLGGVMPQMGGGFLRGDVLSRLQGQLQGPPPGGGLVQAGAGGLVGRPAAPQAPMMPPAPMAPSPTFAIPEAPRPRPTFAQPAAARPLAPQGRGFTRQAAAPRLRRVAGFTSQGEGGAR